jgi:Big-like domain-containing protein
MPEPSQPSFIDNDTAGGTSADSLANGGMAANTNAALPHYSGMANPGETVRFSIDGQEHIVETNESGGWEFTSPELKNGDHDFEVWAETATGERSSSRSWETNVQATEEERQKQQEISDRRLKSTPVSAGSGGTGTAGAGGQAGAGGAAGNTPTSTDLEKGNSPGG